MKTNAIIIHINPYSTKLTACPAVDATHKFVTVHEHCPALEFADVNGLLISR